MRKTPTTEFINAVRGLSAVYCLSLDTQPLPTFHVAITTFLICSNIQVYVYLATFVRFVCRCAYQLDSIAATRCETVVSGENEVNACMSLSTCNSILNIILYITGIGSLRQTLACSHVTAAKYISFRLSLSTTLFTLSVFVVLIHNDASYASVPR